MATMTNKLKEKQRHHFIRGTNTQVKRARYIYGAGRSRLVWMTEDGKFVDRSEIELR